MIGYYEHRPGRASYTMKTIVIALVAWLTCPVAQAADLSGVPRIVDGDTLAIGSTKIRLEGIDAPETDQVCLNANGVYWACGIDARDQLAEKLTAPQAALTLSANACGMLPR
jgi:endonuclease YncB( thermonuclease family)